MCEVKTVLSKKDNGGEVRLHVGEGFSVALDEMSGAGYKWNFTLDKDAAITASDANTQAYPGIGAGSQRRFTFCAEHEGGVDLLLELRRPWEKEGKPADSFQVRVDVDSH
ncbi:hypothetical protein BH10ACI4_BH10ACI4_30310 [soil metagenome]